MTPLYWKDIKLYPGYELLFLYIAILLASYSYWLISWLQLASSYIAIIYCIAM